ncbi:hypothetical protein HanXRQr2_Chr11g0483881 [Helianthus annuus]|uniref:Uncharacterized protein n=1 Tax=Helianthus annuus TaxID=4232 RepID=A0A251TAT5_HELAN|nr:hypothetical protein HanXRQr2_Chr11g0483881 [Helianthus annuus]
MTREHSVNSKNSLQSSESSPVSSLRGLRGDWVCVSCHGCLLPFGHHSSLLQLRQPPSLFSQTELPRRRFKLGPSLLMSCGSKRGSAGSALTYRLSEIKV